jgi:hypothetical protein
VGGTTSGTDAAVDWQAQTNFTDCGQNCIVVSDDSPGGAVYLYYDQPTTNFYFVNDKSSFGKDEVSDAIANRGGVFSAAFYLALDGFTLQQLTVDVPGLVGPGTGGPFSALTGVSISPSATYQPFYDPANLYTPQRILYPFDITFHPSALADFPATGTTAELLTASITVGSLALDTQQILTADTVMTLVAGADPYFSNVDPQQHNAYYLSQDVRVFTISPQSDGPTSVDNLPFTFQTGGPTTLDTAAAYNYIQQVITDFNDTYQNPGGVDPFDLSNPKLPGQGDVYGGDSTVTPVTLEFTGKVTSVRYSRFGDLEGFDLRTESGAERSFRATEPGIEELVVAAWRDRILISVLVQPHDREWPSSIVLRRALRRPRDLW